MRSALALAYSLHVAALLTLGLNVTHRREAGADSAVAMGTEFELEVVVPETTPELTAREAEPAPPAAAARAASKPPAQAAASHAPVHETDVVEELATSDDSAEANAAQPAAPPPDHPVDLGLGPEAWRTWASVVKPDVASARRGRGKAKFRAPPASTTGGLQEGLEAHDRSLGLGPSGPVLGALYRAAHADVAPQTGVALFHVTVLKSGTVEVSLTQATDQTAAWTQVATRAAEALRKAPPAIPSSRSGVSVVIEITAEEVFPNGLKRKQLQGPHLEAQAPRLSSSEKSQAELKKLNPVVGDTGAPATGTPAIVDVPGVYVAQTGKVCSYRLGLSALGPSLSGGCELSNIGAKSQRMVRTQVREETFF